MIITLLTDFGEGSHYVAQMKGVILGLNPDVRIVDISHSVPPQQIEVAARIVDQTTGVFPPGTCHVLVVDPGVGTQRRILLAQIASQWFIAPDNGLLSILMGHHTPDRVLTLTEPRFWRSPVSATFHGRDIMAPVAAHLSLGVTPSDFGVPTEQFESLPATALEFGDKRIRGAIVWIDSFGNLITNIDQSALSVGSLTSARVVCRDHVIQGVSQTYAEHPPGTVVALLGSGGYLELAMVNGNAAALLGLQVGEPVVVNW